MRKIRSGDVVRVITGDHSGSVGQVLKVLVSENKVVVEGVNVKTRYVMREGRKTPVSAEGPIHISNVALYDAAESRLVKVGFTFVERAGEQTKRRFNKRTGNIIE